MDDGKDEELQLSEDQIVVEESYPPLEEEEDEDSEEDQSPDVNDDAANDDGEEVIGFGDDGDAIDIEKPAIREYVKRIESENREKDKRIRELEAAKPVTKLPEIGQEPVWNDDTAHLWDFDGSKFAKEHDAWKARKKLHEDAATEAENQRKIVHQENERVLESYVEKRRAIQKPDVDEAENAVTSALDAQRQSLILRAADDPAKLVYALGKSPTRLAQLTSITDPIKFIAAVGKLEKDIRVQRRKPPEPENVVRGSSVRAESGNDRRTRLEKEAERSGDYSALIAYDEAQKRKAA